VLWQTNTLRECETVSGGIGRSGYFGGGGPMVADAMILCDYRLPHLFPYARKRHADIRCRGHQSMLTARPAQIRHPDSTCRGRRHKVL